MKILFLDIDGVVCTQKEWLLPTLEDGELPFNSNCISALNVWVQLNEIKIVITSTWRKGEIEWLRGIFSKRGFLHQDKIIGETPLLKNVYLDNLRGHEIKKWLLDNNELEYIIIDDVDDFLDEQKQHLYLTDSEKGVNGQFLSKIVI